jgi:hypothetical protein
MLHVKIFETAFKEMMNSLPKMATELIGRRPHMKYEKEFCFYRRLIFWPGTFAWISISGPWEMRLAHPFGLPCVRSIRSRQFLREDTYSTFGLRLRGDQVQAGSARVSLIFFISADSL